MTILLRWLKNAEGEIHLADKPNKINPIKRYHINLIGRIRENKPVFIIFTILRILIVLVMVRSIMIGNYEGTATCVLSLLLLLVPSFLEGTMRLSISPLFEAIIYCFIFAANILGEIANFYTNIPFWDTMLHTLNGFLFAAVGYSTVDLLNRSSKNIKLSPLYLTIVAFCFSMTIGVLWEFFECSMDLFFAKDMQKDFIVTNFQSTKLDETNSQIAVAVKDITSTLINTSSGETYTIDGGYLDIGILDTMKDLFVNFIGAIVFCIFGFIYEKFGEKNKLASSVVKGLKIQSVSEMKDYTEDVEKMKEEKAAKKAARKAKKEQKKASK